MRLGGHGRAMASFLACALRFDAAAVTELLRRCPQAIGAVLIGTEVHKEPRAQHSADDIIHG